MKKTVLLVVALVAIGLVAFAGYRAYERHLTRNTISELVEDATRRLDASLNAQLAGISAADVDSHLAAVEKHSATLGTMKTRSLTRLADAADGMLVTVREILRRMADIERSRGQLARDLDALAEHIKTDRGARNWTAEAMRMKAAVDKNARDYRIAVESYASLLESLPAAQADWKPHARGAVIIDEKLLDKARERALYAHAIVEQDMKRVTSLDAYRLGESRGR